MRGRRHAAPGALALALLCSACGGGSPPEQASPVRPVRTVTIAPRETTSPQTFSGHVEAQDHPTLSFRIGGRIAERPVDAGTTVTQGQVVARLDPENELNALRSARAALAEAESGLRRAEGQHERLARLRERDITSQADYEAAEQARRAAAARVDAARAQLRTAEDVVGFTVLEADAPGVVSAVSAEPGEVVGAGQPVVRLARREGRDAVFEVTAEQLASVDPNADIVVAASNDPSQVARGRVREVSPQSDPVTRTFTVRVGLVSPPRAFLMGASVTGTIAGPAQTSIAVPATALASREGAAGVWLVDPRSTTVSFRPIEIAHADAAIAVVARGLVPGDVVVTAGAGQLREGQKVRLIGTES